jgi:hypothetical protein
MPHTFEPWFFAYGPALLIGAGVAYLIAYLIRRWFRVHIALSILIAVVVVGVLSLPIKTHTVRLEMPAPNSH